jgi:hypothetical protein
MLRTRTLLAPGLALALALMLGGGGASADVVTYNLATANSDLSGFTGPYAQVAVNRADNKHATITFTSLTNGGYTYWLIAHGAAAVNLNASSFTANLKSDNGTFSKFTSDNNLSEFGRFNLVVDNKSAGPTDRATTISFQVTDNGGTWSSARSVLAANSKGQIAASHVGALASGSTNFKQTGYVSGAVAPVPEPSAMAIAGLGALGFIGYGLRRLKK